MELKTQWKNTLMEDYLNRRLPQWKMTSIEDDLNRRQPQWKTTSTQRRSSYSKLEPEGSNQWLYQKKRSGSEIYLELKRY